jgi:phage terminase large subunit GpA-like protein
MSSERSYLRQALATLLLYVLAAPLYLLRGIYRAARATIALHRLRNGAVECPHCGTENPLDILATCRRCRATEYGSRLYCTNCHDRTPAFPCDACGALIRVL